MRTCVKDLAVILKVAGVPLFVIQFSDLVSAFANETKTHNKTISIYSRGPIRSLFGLQNQNKFY